MRPDTMSKQSGRADQKAMSGQGKGCGRDVVLITPPALSSCAFLSAGLVTSFVAHR